MSGDLIDFAEEAEATADEPVDYPELLNIPQTLVTEKIIFCIDILSLTSESDGPELILTILNLLKSYLSLKNKICVRPPEFELLLIVNNDEIDYSKINTVRDLESAIVAIKKYPEEDDDTPLEIDKVFDKIAHLVELPDPECRKKGLPPESVYHIVWLFSRNLYIPTLENTNSFNFLMMTPYVALDILYIYNDSLEDSQCEEISRVLSGLNENGMGYFLCADISSKEKLFAGFAQMLGHPLIRPSQLKAKYKMSELGPKMEPSQKTQKEKEK